MASPGGMVTEKSMRGLLRGSYRAFDLDIKDGENSPSYLLVTCTLF